MKVTEDKKGIVYLLGAGPGDPGLLTLKGKACIQKADVIVYDSLANRIFLEYADENAEMIYVGKKGGDHTLSQEEINGLIVEKASEGLTVVRLKGGDPFIFGRGGEEAQEMTPGRGWGATGIVRPTCTETQGPNHTVWCKGYGRKGRECWAEQRRLGFPGVCHAPVAGVEGLSWLFRD